MRVVRVQGEEDLAGLPAIMLAPLGSIVLYGQPALTASSVGMQNEGIVVVQVSEEKKREILELSVFLDRQEIYFFNRRRRSIFF